MRACTAGQAHGRDPSDPGGGGGDPGQHAGHHREPQHGLPGFGNRGIRGLFLRHSGVPSSMARALFCRAISRLTTNANPGRCAGPAGVPSGAERKYPRHQVAPVSPGKHGLFSCPTGHMGRRGNRHPSSFDVYAWPSPMGHSGRGQGAKGFGGV